MSISLDCFISAVEAGRRDPLTEPGSELEPGGENGSGSSSGSGSGSSAVSAEQLQSYHEQCLDEVARSINTFITADKYQLRQLWVELA